jgi:hypothetical protein
MYALDNGARGIERPMGPDDKVFPLRDGLLRLQHKPGLSAAQFETLSTFAMAAYRISGYSHAIAMINAWTEE